MTTNEYRKLRNAVARGAVERPRKATLVASVDVSTLAAVDKMLARVNPAPLRGDVLGEVYGRSAFVRAAVLALLADTPEDVRKWLAKSKLKGTL